MRSLAAVVAIAGAMLLAGPARAAPADEATRWVRGTLVNLRAAPARDAAVLARLRLNTPVQLQGPEGGEFCAVKPHRGHPAPGYMACALLAPRELSEAALAAELKPWLELYDVLLSQRSSGKGLTPPARAMLLDPREALALLEKRFYLHPSIEALAWYGGLAEDIAYLGSQPGQDGPDSPPLAPRAEWLAGARAAWRTMTGYLEQGWAADDPWPRDGRLRFEPAESAIEAGQPARAWLVPVKPSLFRDDAELYAVSGEPLTLRQLRRGGRGAGAEYVAELSNSARYEDGVAARNGAGGFRGAGPMLEFLKGQPLPPRLRFEHRGSYGINGQLGTVAAELWTPTGSPYLWAVGREGLSRATDFQLSSRDYGCGAGQGMSITLPAPRPTLPLAYLATLKPLDPARFKVTPLGQLQRPTGGNAAVDPMRLQGWRFDLDGDGQADLLVINGRGPAELPTSGVYSNGQDGDGLLSQVFANIGGAWKLVAYAAESGCT